MASVPAKEGTPRNLTRTSGVAERDGTWSPDGKWIAWLSDASGEYEIVLAAADGRSEPKTVTSGGSAFRRIMTFSPDSKQLAFCDKTGARVASYERAGQKGGFGFPAAEPTNQRWGADRLETFKNIEERVRKDLGLVRDAEVATV